MSLDRWVDKEIVVYMCNWVLFSLKKGGPDIFNNTDEPLAYHEYQPRNTLSAGKVSETWQLSWLGNQKVIGTMWSFFGSKRGGREGQVAQIHPVSCLPLIEESIYARYGHSACSPLFCWLKLSSCQLDTAHLSSLRFYQVQHPFCPSSGDLPTILKCFESHLFACIILSPTLPSSFSLKEATPVCISRLHIPLARCFSGLLWHQEQVFITTLISLCWKVDFPVCLLEETLSFLRKWNLSYSGCRFWMNVRMNEGTVLGARQAPRYIVSAEQGSVAVNKE